jgi:hypothetical protein
MRAQRIRAPYLMPTSSSAHAGFQGRSDWGCCCGKQPTIRLCAPGRSRFTIRVLEGIEVMAKRTLPGAPGVEELQIQAAMRDDIQHLNSQLLLYACDSRNGDRLLTLLGAKKNIRTKMAAASARGLGTAIRCGVPLITMADNVEALILRDVHAWPRDTAGDVPAELKALTLESLQFARMTALRDPTLVQLYFWLSRPAAQRLARISLVQINLMSRRRTPLLQLRAQNNAVVWDRLMMGERCAEPMATRISQMTALQALGNQCSTK